ncbi:xanthine dehydrogenase small subunit [Cryobacterium psychrophilum]|uniref:Xanthine dehydrogenase small subunit n=1 Tax=Cryobacterium psychrophilum TaxID=41988 RepID=A0A4Y8KNY3_9MICO|nr:FAD binding domain-containing protein [Cryobacterium psychrophilum]TDW30187.1 xanthine dehydrogenase small subunit [Cryobacterium psychrophilum]TFD77415.1 xanthine dehydrogenase small subunit [Cryobacterium psychrophilum]
MEPRSATGNLSVTVNGKLRDIFDGRAHTTALEWLRGSGLSGAKEGCAEGECGACAIMLAQADGSGGTAWTAVNSCLLPLAALDGQEIVTSEGLATPGTLHPVQVELAERGGSQCGYCTPGFACSMAAEFYRRGRGTESTPVGHPADGGDLDGTEGCGERGPNGFDLHALSGNLCRCTGYRPIRDAAYALGEPDPGDALAARRDRPSASPLTTVVTAPDGTFIRPATLAGAVGLLAEHPDAVLVAGSTDWGVDVNLRGRRSPVVIAIDALPELRGVDVGAEFVQIGAAVTLSEAERVLAGRVPLLAGMFPQFASRLIRNRATFGGNLGTGSPIGDTPPALLALDARLVLASSSGQREVALEEYFTGYRTTVLRPGELIMAVRIPLPLATLSVFHKISKRRFDDISSVAVAFAIDVQNGVVRRARVGLGGVAATPLRAHDTERALTGQPWTSETAADAARVLGTEGTPMDDHRASARYRSAMLEQALLKFYSDVTLDQEAVS